VPGGGFVRHQLCFSPDRADAYKSPDDDPEQMEACSRIFSGSSLRATGVASTLVLAARVTAEITRESEMAEKALSELTLSRGP
jgi:hypothetical protein